MSVTADRLVLAAPLGVALWDVAGARFVSDGLIVSASPASQRAQRVMGAPNRSGVFVFHHLPGLMGFERGAQDVPASPSPPTSRRFVVDVRDPSGRFLPLSLALDAPVRGLVQFGCAPGQLARAALPLYSAPGRPAPAGLALVRAQLQVAGSGVPAAWAVLELDLPGRPGAARGIADALGQVAVLFPYPEPAGVPIGSPGGASGPPLAQQSWAVRARARFGALASGPTPPDLCAILNQPSAMLFADASASTALGSANLVYGRELVLRSLAAAGQSPLPVVLIGPAGSPP